MRIGRLGIADAAQLDESRRAYAVELGGSGEADVAFTRRLLSDPGVRVWGAIEGSALVGFTVVTEPPDAIHGIVTGMMDDLFVAPTWRRRGIAQAILAAIGAHAKAEGWSHVRWLVHEGDAPRSRSTTSSPSRSPCAATSSGWMQRGRCDSEARDQMPGPRRCSLPRVGGG
jgi:GNAT superfamily N-acetyltransferase